MIKRKIFGIVFVFISMLLSLANIFSVKITGAFMGIGMKSSFLTILTFVFFFGGLLFLSSLEKKLIALAIGAGVIGAGAIVGRGIAHKIYSNREKQYLSDIKITFPAKTIHGKFQRTYRWDEILDEVEEKYKIPKGLLKGLAMRESYGDPLRLNEGKDGGAGLFMFQPRTAKAYGLKVYGSSDKSSADYKHGEELKKLLIENKNNYAKMAKIDERFDIKKSPNAAGRYLRDDNDRYGSWNKALSAYNQGTPAPNPLKTKHVKAVRKYQKYYNRRDKH